MKKIALVIVTLFIAWIGSGIYTGYVNTPEIEWENGKIVRMNNCERKNNNYNDRCSRVICEYELSQRREVEDFIAIQMIKQVNKSAVAEYLPARSSHLIEVTFEDQKKYFSCQMERDKLIALEQTTKNEFDRKNDL